VEVRTDDEVYRVDAVWLGPPKATFPWRARYVAWGVGILVFFLTLTVERWVGFGFGFFSLAWALVITVGLTRFLCSRISHERPLGAVLALWMRELTSPREKSAGPGGAVSATRVRVHAQRPRPKDRTTEAAARRTPKAVEAPRYGPGRQQRAVTSSWQHGQTAGSQIAGTQPVGTQPPGPIAVTGRQPLPPTPPGWQQPANPQRYQPHYGGPEEPWSVRRDPTQDQGRTHRDQTPGQGQTPGWGQVPGAMPESRSEPVTRSRSRRAARRR